MRFKEDRSHGCENSFPPMKLALEVSGGGSKSLQVIDLKGEKDLRTFVTISCFTFL